METLVPLGTREIMAQSWRNRIAPTICRQLCVIDPASAAAMAALAVERTLRGDPRNVYAGRALTLMPNGLVKKDFASALRIWRSLCD